MKTPFLRSLDFALVLMILGSRAFGSTVLWDFFGSAESGSHPLRDDASLLSIGRGWGIQEDEYYRETFDSLIGPSINIMTFRKETQRNKAVIQAETENLAPLLYGSNWVLAEAGMLADAATTRNQDSYFLNGWMDGNLDYSGTDSLECFYGQTFDFYLAFAAGREGDYDEQGVSLDREVWYGWVQIQYSRGTLSVLRSALCTDPNVGIYVGTDRTTSVPEPAVAGIELAGALLLLRRRKA